MGMWKSYAENETFWTVFINGNNKDSLVHYHWVLSLEIIERTEISLLSTYGMKWNFDYLFVIVIILSWCGHLVINRHW